MLLSGDVPLLNAATLGGLVDAHRRDGRRGHRADRRRRATRTATAASSATGGQIARIVEERDASPAERAIKEINAGVYAFDLEPLFAALRSIAAQNARASTT